jgi:hypothetical protein
MALWLYVMNILSHSDNSMIDVRLFFRKIRRIHNLKPYLGKARYPENARQRINLCERILSRIFVVSEIDRKKYVYMDRK